MAIARIKKNDTVIVTCGNDAGKTGIVAKVNPKEGTAVVTGLNVHKKAMRRTRRTRAASSASSSRSACASSCRTTPRRSAARASTGEKDGKKARVSVKSGKAL